MNWTFSSRVGHTGTWYMTAIVVILSLAIYGLTQQLYIMTIVALLFPGVYLLIENNSLPTTTVSIDEGGINVGSTRYDYTMIEKFSLISIGGVPTFLRITIRKKIGASIDIPLTQEVNPGELRDTLTEHIEEDKNATLSNTDAIIHAMRL